MNNYFNTHLALAQYLFSLEAETIFFNQEITYCHFDLSKELRPTDSNYCRSAQF